MCLRVSNKKNTRWEKPCSSDIVINTRDAKTTTCQGYQSSDPSPTLVAIIPLQRVSNLLPNSSTNYKKIWKNNLDTQISTWTGRIKRGYADTSNCILYIHCLYIGKQKKVSTLPKLPKWRGGDAFTRSFSRLSSLRLKVFTLLYPN